MNNLSIIPPRFANRPVQDPMQPEGRPVKGEIRPRPHFAKIPC